MASGRRGLVFNVCFHLRLSTELPSLEDIMANSTIDLDKLENQFSLLSSKSAKLLKSGTVQVKSPDKVKPPDSEKLKTVKKKKRKIRLPSAAASGSGNKAKAETIWASSGVSEWKLFFDFCFWRICCQILNRNKVDLKREKKKSSFNESDMLNAPKKHLNYIVKLPLYYTAIQLVLIKI